MSEFDGVLDDVAVQFASTILEAVQREYPNDLRHRLDDADDRPTPRQVHPAFYGCYDWHSAVEMHWALVRLLRRCPDHVPADARAVLDLHLSADALRIEADYFDERPAFGRPYGWGWAFTLSADLADWDDPDARRWSANIEPLATRLSTLLQRWLPTAEYPVRFGMHPNSAFSLARAWRHAEHDEALRDVIIETARRWFAHDRDYPAAWEPSGADFLSGALTEAELMSMVLPPDEFVTWWSAFLPDLPPALRVPVRVTDASDGQLAHLHGLNLHRAHGLRVVSAALGGVADYDELASAHFAASLDAVSGSDYMVEHWLAAFATLALTGP